MTEAARRKWAPKVAGTLRATAVQITVEMRTFMASSRRVTVSASYTAGKPTSTVAEITSRFRREGDGNLFRPNVLALIQQALRVQ